MFNLFSLTEIMHVEGKAFQALDSKFHAMSDSELENARDVFLKVIPDTQSTPESFSLYFAMLSHVMHELRFRANQDEYIANL